MVDELEVGQSEFDFSGTPGIGAADAEISGDSPNYHVLLKHVDAFSTSIHDQEIQMELLNALVIQRQIEGKTVPSGRPIESGWLSSTYGWRIDPFSGKRRFHNGVDFAGQRGTEVMAVASGRATGTHVHFEVLRHDRKVSPVKFIGRSS